jgi:hypothetical protein
VNMSCMACCIWQANVLLVIRPEYCLLATVDVLLVYPGSAWLVISSGDLRLQATQNDQAGPWE